MLESFEGSLDIVWYQEGDCSMCVVPLEGHVAELLACPVVGKFVFGLEVLYEGFGVCFVFVFDAEVICDEAEGDGS